MGFFCKELKKEFATKTEMFAELKANKDVIIAMKKTVKFSDFISLNEVAKNNVAKAEDASTTELKFGDYIYPVINTTNWLDSHGDVHIDGIWDVSVQDQQGKVYYIINHELEIGKVIAYPEDVEPMVKEMNWSDFGKDTTGTTQALIFKVKLTERGNSDANKAIMGKVALQNSIRMQYVRMKLCINSNSEYDKEEYGNWLQYIDRIANKELAYEQEYFWAVLEAKIYKEGSAVLFGSNEMTPIFTSLEEKGNPSVDSSKSENKNSGPSADSQAVVKRSIIYQLM